MGMRVVSLGKWLLVVGFFTGQAPAWADNHVSQPPKQVQNSVDNIRLMGQGTLRWFGLRVYDGQLWSNTDPQSFNYKRDTAWLELKYARNLSGKDIAERSIEEIEGIGAGNDAKRQEWLKKLTEIFPDVKEGHTLSAFFQPGKGIQFFRNGQAHAKIDDLELSEAFMGIWLDPKTSAPEMRKQLIGLKR